jgi:hypothetical protein
MKGARRRQVVERFWLYIPALISLLICIQVGDGPDGPHGTDENALWRERAFDF